MTTAERISERAGHLTKYHGGRKMAAILGITMTTLSKRLKEHKWKVNEAAIVEQEARKVSKLMLGDNL